MSSNNNNELPLSTGKFSNQNTKNKNGSRNNNELPLSTGKFSNQNTKNKNGSRNNNELPLSTGKFFKTNTKKNNGLNKSTRTNGTTNNGKNKLTNNTRKNRSSNNKTKVSNTKKNDPKTKVMRMLGKENKNGMIIGEMNNNNNNKSSSSSNINKGMNKEKTNRSRINSGTSNKNKLSPNKKKNKIIQFSNSTKEGVTEDKSTNPNNFTINEKYTLQNIFTRKPFGKIFRDPNGKILMYSTNLSKSKATFKEIVYRNGSYQVKNYQKKDENYQINYHKNGKIEFNTKIHKFNDPITNKTATKIYTYLGTLNNLNNKYPYGIIFKIYNPNNSTGKHKPPKQPNTLFSKVTGYFTGKK